ncbi:hypothetical protein PMAYCL1PPCAC_28473 [Pristionchus mayeri]|uniref:Uncharacterized protein n=1 Tax=Pristionchus mayeri TaxID=1317129 RepID=A0AAN5D7N0_9BILA|nr:hypothetical protein PMAYCL1PPCAC_28473 [Pristionchus mayeri]
MSFNEKDLGALKEVEKEVIVLTNHRKMTYFQLRELMKKAHQKPSKGRKPKSDRKMAVDLLDKTQQSSQISDQMRTQKTQASRSGTLTGNTTRKTHTGPVSSESKISV